MSADGCIAGPYNGVRRKSSFRRSLQETGHYADPDQHRRSILADTTADEPVRKGHRLWPRLQGWAVVLGLTRPDAIGAVSQPPGDHSREREPDGGQLHLEDADDAVRDRAARWVAHQLANDQAVLVVDETGDEKSSTDAVGAARQYSGALGGIGLCQVAVLLTSASRRRQALLGRALYLPRDWAADDERRELTGVPDELAFATKPQLAAAMLERAREAGMPARWVAADEVYGGRDLRTRIRELGYDYAIAVPASHRVTTPAGRFTVTSLLDRLPRRAWQRVRAGHGAKGDRHYDWAMIEADPDDTPWGA